MPIHFRRTALAGFAVAITVFVVGMGLGIRRMNSVARAHEIQMGAREHEISLADRLRWRGDLVVSVAREYVHAREPDILPKWRAEEIELEQVLRPFLEEGRLDDETALLADVARDASEFLRVQARLRAAISSNSDNDALVHQFEAEVVPKWRALEAKLDQLANHAAVEFRATYHQAEEDRRRSTSLMYISLGILALVAFGVAGYFTRQLSRMYLKERSAHEVARRAIAIRDELMGVVAHDLRSPLGAITLSAALLRERADTEATRKQAQSIERIAMRMDYLIKTMLDVATIEAGQFSVHPTACRIEDLLREVGDMFGNLSESKQVRLEWKVTPPELQVCADRERVLQVLTNLVANGLKFTPPGGRVSITVDMTDRQARFAIADTGTGIAVDDLPRVFDRFWKKDSVTQKGTGLGLFIAKSIVDAHGGRIWVESRQGGGAVFYFTLAVTASAELQRNESLVPAPK